jgi:hypothetical protein
LGFLGPEPFCGKFPCFKPWISLDFLGFSRPKLDLSMGYAGFSLKEFSAPFLPQRSPRAGNLGVRKCGIVHSASLV